MEEFTISLAEIPIGIRPLCPEIQPFFTDYLSEEAPRFTVAASKKDLEYEQTMFDRRNGEELLLPPRSASSLEVSALLRKIANRIDEYDTLLFHGSVVAVDGKAYLFTAPSGTGKTTHTRLWLQQLPQAFILNGDKPFLKADSSGHVLACGTPWMGKEQFGRNLILPLEAICILERAKENHIASVTQKEAGRELLHRAHLPDGIAGVHAIELLNRIVREVRLFRLGCNMEAEAAQVSIRAMLNGSSADRQAEDEACSLRVNE